MWTERPNCECGKPGVRPWFENKEVIPLCFSCYKKKKAENSLKEMVNIIGKERVKEILGD